MKRRNWGPLRAKLDEIKRMSLEMPPHVIERQLGLPHRLLRDCIADGKRWKSGFAFEMRRWFLDVAEEELIAYAEARIYECGFHPQAEVTIESTSIDFETGVPRRIRTTRRPPSHAYALRWLAAKRPAVWGNRHNLQHAGEIKHTEAPKIDVRIVGDPEAAIVKAG